MGYVYLSLAIIAEVIGTSALDVRIDCHHAIEIQLMKRPCRYESTLLPAVTRSSGYVRRRCLTESRYQEI